MNALALDQQLEDEKNMRKLYNRRQRGALAGVAVTATALIATLTPSAAAAEISDPPSWDSIITAALLKRVSEGTGTVSDVNSVKRDPELAKIVPDPSRTETTVQEAVFTEDGKAIGADGNPLTAEQLANVMPPASATPSNAADEVITPEETEVDEGTTTALAAAARITGGRWKMTHITHTHRSYLGSVIFKYHTYAEFNYGSGKVRDWGTRYDDFTNVQSIVDIGDKLIVNTKSRVPATSATTMMKRKAQLCVAQYGCYANLYPWAKTQVYGTGKTKYAGSGV